MCLITGGTKGEIRDSHLLTAGDGTQKTVTVPNKRGYVDTHVAVVELEDLWKQYWHRGYEPRDDVVVPD